MVVIKFLFYIIIGVIIVFILKNENNYWLAFKYFIALVPLLNLLLFILSFSKIFPNGIKGKINKFEFNKFISFSIALLLFSAFSLFISNIFYEKSYETFSSINLGFCAGCIIWALISLILKFYKKSTRIKIYENIFALILLITIFIYGIYSIETQFIKGDKDADLPFAFNLIIVVFHNFTRNFKSLFLYQKAKIDTKVNIIEISTYTIIGFLIFIFSIFVNYKYILLIYLFGIIYFLSFPLIKQHIYNFLKAKNPINLAKN